MRKVIIEPGKAYEVAHGIAVEFLGAHPTHWRVAHDARTSRRRLANLREKYEDSGRKPERFGDFKEHQRQASMHGYALEILIPMWLEREEFDKWGDVSLCGWISDEIYNMHYSEFTQSQKLRMV